MTPEVQGIIIVAIIGGAFPLTAAIIRYGGRKNGSTARDSTPVHKKCTAHSGIEADIYNLKDGQDRIEETQNNMWDEMKGLRVDFQELPGIVIKAIKENK